MIPLDLPDSDIQYYPNFLTGASASLYFHILRNTIPWQQDDIKVFGKVYAQPRLTSFFGDRTKSYTYSNITMRPKCFTKELLQIKTEVEEQLRANFNACLLNLYRDGKDSNGWHADDEKVLGNNPLIASVSLGQERYFHLRHKKQKELKYKMRLAHGSLLVMKGKTQHCWQHQLPKTSKAIGERINLTFRTLH